MTYYNPPRWAKDAIPTERGWVSPKNGELLVSCKLDMSKFIQEEKNEDLGAAVLDGLKPEELSVDESLTPGNKSETTKETQEVSSDESELKPKKKRRAKAQ